MMQRLYTVNCSNGEVYNVFAMSERHAIQQVALALYNRVLSGETVTTYEKEIYDTLCKMLSENNVDFISGDIDPSYPDEPYYIELN